MVVYYQLYSTVSPNALGVLDIVIVTLFISETNDTCYAFPNMVKAFSVLLEPENQDQFIFIVQGLKYVFSVLPGGIIIPLLFIISG